MVCNCFKRLDSGLAVIPDLDPGRNDGKRYFGTFYEIVNFDALIFCFIISVSGRPPSGLDSLPSGEVHHCCILPLHRNIECESDIRLEDQWGWARLQAGRSVCFFVLDWELAQPTLVPGCKGGEVFCRANQSRHILLFYPGTLLPPGRLCAPPRLDHAK